MKNLNFMGKNIMVTSRYVLTLDPKDIMSTVIDGSRLTHKDTASGVLFVSGGDSTAAIQRFTLMGETGIMWRNGFSDALSQVGIRLMEIVMK